MSRELRRRRVFCNFRVFLSDFPKLPWNPARFSELIRKKNSNIFNSKEAWIQIVNIFTYFLPFLTIFRQFPQIFVVGVATVSGVPAAACVHAITRVPALVGVPTDVKFPTVSGIPAAAAAVPAI